MPCPRCWSAPATIQTRARTGCRPRCSACTKRRVPALRDRRPRRSLDLRLHRLTGLEQDKILAEYGELLDLIRDLSDILARPERLLLK